MKGERKKGVCVQATRGGRTLILSRVIVAGDVEWDTKNTRKKVNSQTALMR
jgi:hypothetical protein